MKGFNKYNLPPWLRNFRDVLKQFIVPISVFQGIRTFLIPT
ncbi:MAG: rane protein, partial [Bacillales bacterium]|nr:rane protein [Bacillales bacterium]